ncbi:MAG: AbrB family transcriptional regulator [archaeon]
MNIIKMSSKGQLVVPQSIRELADLEEGERFVAFPIKKGVVFKKVEIPSVSFEELAKEIQQQFKRNGIKKSDVAEAVRWARG